MSKRQFRFTGAGGQGILTAGDFLCDAAIKYGMHSVKIGTYTSQVRGGPTAIDVLCDMDEIYYPYAIDGEIEFMLSVANSSYQAFKKGVMVGGVIVIDPNLVLPTSDDRKTWKIIEIPIVEISKKEIGHVATQSAMALGIAVTFTECVPPEILLETIIKKVPSKSVEANKKAFLLGIEYAKKIK